MQKINFEDGQLVKKGYVEIDGTQYFTEEAEYDGATPLSAHVLNKMQDNIEEAIDNIDLTDYYNKSEVDAKLEAVEGNEVYIGNEEDAPATAKIVIDEDETDWEDEGEIYSTTERKVGKWIDGKTLYRKTITANLDFNNPSSTGSDGSSRIDITIPIANIDSILLDEAASFIRFSNNYIVSINNYSSNNDYVKTNINSSNNVLRIMYGSSLKTVTGSLHVTLKYTKTTDEEA